MTNKNTPISPPISNKSTLLDAVKKVFPALLSNRLMLVSPERSIELEDSGYLRVSWVDGKEYLVDVWMHKTEPGVFHIHEVLEIT